MNREDFFGVVQGKTVTAAGAFHCLAHAITFHRLDPQTDRRAWVGSRFRDAALHSQINLLQIVAFRHRDDVPAEIFHSQESRLHAERVLADAPGKFGVVIRNRQDERVQPILGGQSRVAAKASLASPSIDAASDTVQIVTRSFLLTLSASASPCDCGNAEPSGPLLR